MRTQTHEPKCIYAMCHVYENMHALAMNTRKLYGIMFIIFGGLLVIHCFHRNCLGTNLPSEAYEANGVVLICGLSVHKHRERERHRSSGIRHTNT